MTETERPALTITEAAQAAGVDRRTIRRHLERTPSAFPAAYRDTGPQGPGTGAWRIPVADLLAAGFTLHASRPETPAPLAPAPVATDELADLRAQLEAERAGRAEERARREGVEQLAEERRETIDHLRHVVDELTKRVPELEPATTRDMPPRRRWWQRRQ